MIEFKINDFQSQSRSYILLHGKIVIIHNYFKRKKFNGILVNLIVFIY